MKKIVYTLCFMLSTTLCAMAQPGERKGNGRFGHEEFRARTEAFITQKVGFSPEDAKAFFALYNEMKSKQWEIQKKIFQLKRNEPDSNATKEKFTSVILEIKSLNVEMAQLEEEYYKRMCKAVPADKVYAAMKLEDDFHRQMLSKFNGPQNLRTQKTRTTPNR